MEKGVLKIVFLILLLSFFIFPVASAFSGPGNGIFVDPYIITNCTQLQEMKDNLSASYALGNDIDFVMDSGCSQFNSGAGFEPIGDFANSFEGTFDGRNKTINYLYINRPLEDYVGLFGATGNFVNITSLGLVNVNIIGSLIALGGFVGRNHGNISNCFVIGNVSGAIFSSVGGLVGDNYGYVFNCHSVCNVSGTSYLGGLIGENFMVVSNSYSTGSVSGTEKIGGLIGYNNGTVIGSFSSANVSGTVTVGGLVGQNVGTAITNSYWNNVSSPSQCYSGGETGCTAIQNNLSYFQGDVYPGSSPFTGWSFYGIWQERIEDYPHLKWEGVGGNILNGAGTVGDPYQITNCLELQEMKNDLDASYALMNNVDCSETRNWNGGKGFEPVGTYSYLEDLTFRGNLNGNNHTIGNLFINRPTEDYVGLFGATRVNSNLSNIGLNNADITGATAVGGFIGYGFGNISNCYLTGNIFGLVDTVGGFIGYNGGTIFNSYFIGNVSGEFWTGGFMGGNFGIISNCYSVGNTSGEDIVGGFGGDNVGTLSNSFSTSDVFGISNVGGLISSNAGTITNSYWNKPVGSSLQCYSGGNDGCTVIQNNLSYFKGNVFPSREPFADWDFFGTWQEREGDYPVLTWQGLGGEIIDCESHNYFLCEDNDVYWFDSCGVREDKIFDCGEDSESANYCFDGDVYKDYTYNQCVIENCVSNVIIEKQEDCSNGCNNGRCVVYGKADFAWFLPLKGMFDVLIYNEVTGIYSEKFIYLGGPSDIPVPADYDGDKITDAAVLKTNGLIIVKKSSNNGILISPQGNSYWKPAVADYDGDDKADFAWWRQNTGEWVIYKSSLGYVKPTFNPRWGRGSDKPIPADYDGDGKADLAVYRTDGRIAVFLSSNSQNLLSPRVSFALAPAVADYDGDGKADFAWFIHSTAKWKIFTSSTNYQEVLPNPIFGDANSVPIPADYDGDGKADIAVFNYMKNGKITFKSSMTGSIRTSPIGNPNWRPAVGDYGN